MPMHSDDLDWIRGYSLRFLAGHGIEAVVDANSDLSCADGTTYRFEEIVRLCASTARGNWAQAISGHLDALMAVRSEPRVSDLTAAELETQVRARVLPSASIALSATDLSYARPITDDLSVVLCVERHRAPHPGRTARVGFRPPGTAVDDAPTTRFAPLPKPGSAAEAVLIADEPRTDRFPAAHAIPTNPFRVITGEPTPDEHDDVIYLDAAQVAAHGRDRLFTIGIRNTDAEPLDRVATSTDKSLKALGGASVFVASKILTMRSLLAHVYTGQSTEHGVVFGIPDRHRIFLHRISGPSAVPAINELASLTAQHHENTADGVSPNIYHWHRDRITRISRAESTEQKLSITITPGPTLEDILNSLT
ncbi:hypothetical protein GII30_02000 [Gordonia amarae]|uniref:Uncharacterized protein n=1 Tax=Gordonia amarae TaxID=36821 RepID=A0A857M777_9ACTN|nr:hypothetical protein [Gordonia amarae]MCS3877124.1 hypothetical protein [Gordonia amarae]QHN15919.1 hypothetical protein GII35_02000 [Gordonia amarae]QHN20487.1 hypothetical protein GII34_02000 [Gordonia amarae]QHN29339.1 hypothetical protein GII32_02005 [Gordonia amarae]QHN38118.1 hypothetical protein GII30_02000 [Gordonia amarae]